MNEPSSLNSPSIELPANQVPFNSWPALQTAIVQAKLPKLVVHKFGENTSKWLEFWDPFERAINKNETWAKIDKFSYFEGFLIEQVRICPHIGKLQSRVETSKGTFWQTESYSENVH